MEKNQETSHDFPPFFRVHKDGQIHRYLPTDFVPPSQHPQTGVKSKDITISPPTKLSARIYLPNQTPGPNNPKRKFPLLVYMHGGAFSIQSPFSSVYHNYLNNLVSESEVVVVSVDYRLAPENPLPACYDDSWCVLNWVVSHSRYQNLSRPEKPEPSRSQNLPGPEKPEHRHSGNHCEKLAGPEKPEEQEHFDSGNDCQNFEGPEKPEEWLIDHVDYTRVFLGGDSAGANIAHDLMVRASKGDKEGIFSSLKLEGMILIHPFFGNGKEVDKLWEYIYPGTSGLDDPRLNPVAHVDILASLECRRVLVCVAEKDGLRKRGWSYYEALKRSGWRGELEIVETKGQSHVFHLLDPSCEDAGVFMKQVTSFIKKTGLASL